MKADASSRGSTGRPDETKDAIPRTRRRKKPEPDGPTIVRKRSYSRPNAPDPETIARDFFEDLVPGWLSGPLEGHDEFYRDPVSGSEDFVWRPWDGTGPDCSIYRALVNRCDYLERLIRRAAACGTEEADRAMRALQEWQDSHSYLTLFMERTGWHTDTLLATYDADHSRSHRPIDVIGPRPGLAFGLGEMPDLTVHAYYLKIGGDRDDLSQIFESAADRRLVEILNKASPFPCKGRQVATILQSAMSEGEPGGDVVFDCVCRIFLGGFLGLYPHCAVTGCFRLRRQLVNWWMNWPKHRASLESFIDRNKTLVTYVLREFLFFSISRCSPLEDYMTDHYFWWGMKRIACNAMDEVRRMLNEEMLFRGEGPDSCLFEAEEGGPPGGGPIFLKIEDVLAEYNKKNLKLCPRQMEKGFTDKMVAVATNAEIDDAVERRMVEAPPRDFAGYADEVARIKRVVLESHDPMRPMSYEWLAPLYGVSLFDTILPLKEAEHLYRSDTDRTGLEKAIKKVLARSPRDFRLVQAFFSATMNADGVRLYDLPLHLARKQMARFREAYNLQPGMELPPTAGLHYVCPNCCRVKAQVVRLGSKQQSSAKADKIFYDLLSGRKFCKKLPSIGSSSSSGKKKAANSYEISTRKLVKKSIREELRKVPATACPHTEVIPIQMIGRILVTKEDGAVLFCPECLEVTSLSRENARGGNGIFSCGCARPPEPQVEECRLCDPARVRKKPIIQHRPIYDDEADPPRLGFMAVCDEHSCNWILKWNVLHRISTVRKAISEGWTSIVVEKKSGDRVFLDHHNNALGRLGRRF